MFFKSCCSEITSPSKPVQETMTRHGELCCDSTRILALSGWALILINDEPLPNRLSIAKATQSLPAMARHDPPFMVDGSCCCWARLKLHFNKIRRIVITNQTNESVISISSLPTVLFGSSYKIWGDRVLSPVKIVSSMVFKKKNEAVKLISLGSKKSDSRQEKFPYRTEVSRQNLP